MKKNLSASSNSQDIPTINEALKEIFGSDNIASLGADLVDETTRFNRLRSIQFPSCKNTRIIAVSNQKGGVGKTTSAVNLAAALALAGKEVLILDMDPQGNASTALGIPHGAGMPSIYDVLEGRKNIEEVVLPCEDFKTLEVVPSSIDLSGAELEIASLKRPVILLKRALRKYLAKSKHYDYVFIDCAPSLGLLVLNSLNAAEEVLIPIQAEYYALEGLGQLVKTIGLVQDTYNSNLELSAILVTMYDRRTALSQQVYKEVEKYYPDAILHTVIPRSVRISEAPSYNQSVIAYEPRSIGAIAYREAAFEIALRGVYREQYLQEQGVLDFNTYDNEEESISDEELYPQFNKNRSSKNEGSGNFLDNGEISYDSQDSEDAQLPFDNAQFIENSGDLFGENAMPRNLQESKDLFNQSQVFPGENDDEINSRDVGGIREGSETVEQRPSMNSRENDRNSGDKRAFSARSEDDKASSRAEDNLWDLDDLLAELDSEKYNGNPRDLS